MPQPGTHSGERPKPAPERPKVSDIELLKRNLAEIRERNREAEQRRRLSLKAAQARARHLIERERIFKTPKT